MSRRRFKEFMIAKTHGYYYLVMPSVFTFVAGCHYWLNLVLWQPINHVLFWHDSVPIRVLGGFILFVSFLIDLQANMDMEECDPFGLSYVG
mmetsp:Transcript_7330/g.5615  ORF Transcript_7330/g.5615 Transcript_7330/m.5615 type:complete len:91 (+) Transcript_7330:260-532(+)